MGIVEPFPANLRPQRACSTLPRFVASTTYDLSNPPAVPILQTSLGVRSEHHVGRYSLHIQYQEATYGYLRSEKALTARDHLKHA